MGFTKKKRGGFTGRPARKKQNKEAASASDSTVTEAFRLELQQKLNTFKQERHNSTDTIQSLKFENCSKPQRQVIHQAVTAAGLYSKSTGPASARCLVVYHAPKHKKLLASDNANGSHHDTSSSISTMALTKPPPQAVQDALSLLLRQNTNTSCSVSESSTLKSVGDNRPVWPSLRTKDSRSSYRKRKGLSSLPVHASKDRICKTIAENPCTLISGATGSGKSTQVPQFLSEEGTKDGQRRRIVVTQPRRLSAMSLAERVAWERNEEVGGSVGYAIRGDYKYSRENTEIIFVTTGLLLRWLASDPTASGFSHIIIDEVHERDRFSDILLIQLRSILFAQQERCSSTDLKVVLMSATLQTQTFVSYFNECPHISIDGRTFPVTSLFLEQTLWLLNGGGGGGRSNNAKVVASCPTCQAPFASYEEFGTHVATCFGGSNSTVVTKKVELSDKLKVLNSCTASQAKMKQLFESYDQTQQSFSGELEADLSLVIKVLEHIEEASYGPGAVLIFLSGWQPICELQELLMSHPVFSQNYLVVPLHSSLTSAEQRAAFNTNYKCTRKIVLSTNIAETSVTIDDVVYVIDTGVVKMKSYDDSLSISTLQTSWVSRASATQRRGRAGRVSAGVCFHLFSTSRFDAMAEFHLPEILRTPLAELMLQIKAWDSTVDLTTFLLQAPDPPSKASVKTSISRLGEIGALLLPSETLTNLGWQLSTLPLDPMLGKTIFVSHLVGCFTSYVRIAAILNSRDPFLLSTASNNTSGKSVSKIKVGFAKTQSDPMMLLSVVNAFEASTQKQNFCYNNSVSQNVLSSILKTERQLFSELSRIGYQRQSSSSSDEKLTSMLVSYGNYPNLVHRSVGHTNYQTHDHHKVKFHPSSIIPSVQKVKKKKKNTSDDMPTIFEYLTFSELILTDTRRSMYHGSVISSIALMLLWGNSESLIEEIEDSTILNLVLDVEKKSESIVFRLEEREWAENVLAFRKLFRNTLDCYISTDKKKKVTTVVNSIRLFLQQNAAAAI